MPGRSPGQRRCVPRHRSLDSVPVRRALRVAARQGGVLSRRQLYAVGVTRWQVRAHVRGGRWRCLGDQAVHLANGPVSEAGERWAAVFQGGPHAQLDGATALVASGLERFDPGRLRVSVPRGVAVRRTTAFDIRQTRRWSASDRAPSGIPRTRPEVAAVRAFLWARTDRQATYVLSLTVQQGIASPQAIGETFLGDYVLPFEVTSLVLLVAAIGGIVLGLTGRARHDRLRKLMQTRSADQQKRIYEQQERELRSRRQEVTK